MMPAGVRTLCSSHRVIIESGAGAGIGCSDEAYRSVGAEVVDHREEVYSRADLILKVKEPLPEEYPLLRPGQILFTYLHLSANKTLTEALVRSEATCIAYESVQVERRLPLLEPMSEIAGRAAVIVGAGLLGRHHGGSGDLIGGVPGVAPSRVVVLGGGTAGVNAARMAVGLGAKVTILEIDAERMRFLDLILPGSTLYSNESALFELLPDTDLLIGAILLPGAKAPRLLHRRMLQRMKPGSVFVDIAIDQGGCAETSRATTHAAPTFVEEGVVHYCVANMPGAYPRTATQALTNATFPYVANIARLGLDAALDKDPGLRCAVAVERGMLRHRAVADAHGLAMSSLNEPSALEVRVPTYVHHSN